jgi:hypothetical protein
MNEEPEHTKHLIAKQSYALLKRLGSSTVWYTQQVVWRCERQTNTSISKVKHTQTRLVVHVHSSVPAHRSADIFAWLLYATGHA